MNTDFLPFLIVMILIAVGVFVYDVYIWKPTKPKPEAINTPRKTEDSDYRLEQIAKNTESIKRGIWVLVIVFVVIPLLEGCKGIGTIS